MSGKIVSFPKAEKIIWVCGCGCSTFILHVNGYSECAACNAEVIGESGGWYELIKDGPERPDDAGPVTVDVQGNGSLEFAKARLQKAAAADNVKAIIVVNADGHTSAWNGATTKKQFKWVQKRLRDGMKMLKEHWDQFDEV